MNSENQRQQQNQTPEPSGGESPGEQLEITLPGEAVLAKDVSLWAGLLVVLALVVFWPATDGQFFNADTKNVADNMLIAQPGGVSTLWFGRWNNSAEYKLPQYHPVAYSAYALEYRLGGHDEKGLPTPFAYHLGNLILHAGAAVLAWLVLRKLKLPGSWLAAAVFAVHPINAEVVSWISQQATGLSAVLSLGSILAYLYFADDDAAAIAGAVVDPLQRWGLYAASLVLFVLAMLSKSTAVGLPIVLLLAMWGHRRLSARHVGLVLPMIVIGIVLSFMAVDFERAALSSIHVHLDLTAVDRLSIAGRAVWFYIAKLLLPIRLSFQYSKWNLESGIAIGLIGAFGVVAGLLGLWIARQSAGRWLFIAAAAFVLFLFPMLGFVDVQPMRFSFVTDHHAYLASLPIAAMVIAGAALAVRRINLGRTPVIALSGILLVVLGSAAWVRAHVFADSVSVWTDVVAKNPNSTTSQNELTSALINRADLDGAAGDDDSIKQRDADLDLATQHAQAAVSLNTSDAVAQWLWGKILQRQKKPLDAAMHFEASVRLDDSHANSWQDYGLILIDLKKYNDAIAKLDRALAMDSLSSVTHRLLAIAYEGRGDNTRAMAEEREAIRLKPDDLAAHEHLAALLVNLGTPAADHEAIAHLTVVVQVQKTRSDLWAKLGFLYFRSGDRQAAIMFMKQAVELDPTNELAQKELAEALAKEVAIAATRPATRAAVPATAP